MAVKNKPKKIANKKRPNKVKSSKSLKDLRIKVPSIGQIYKTSWFELSTFWRSMLGVVLVYAILNFIFIASFALLPSSEDLQLQVDETIGEGANRIVSSITLVGVSLYDYSSPSNTMVQIVLFMVASSAFIWTLRKQQGLKKISIRQTYYEGPANIIPLLIVSTLLLLTLIPASLGSGLLSFGLPAANTLLEKIVLYSASFALVYLTIYWMLVWWPAFYIAMLPGSKPIVAMRAAAKLTKGIRFRLFLRLLGIFITLGVIFIAVAIPVSLIWQRIIPVTVYLLLFLLFAIMHTMIFGLYRGTVDERS